MQDIIHIVYAEKDSARLISDTLSSSSSRIRHADFVGRRYHKTGSAHYINTQVRRVVIANEDGNKYVRCSQLPDGDILIVRVDN